MKPNTVKINQVYCHKIIKDMMDKYQVKNYADLYDILVEQIEQKVSEMPDNVIAKKTEEGWKERVQFAQDCLNNKETHITREYFSLDNIVSNIEELNQLLEKDK